MLTFPLRYRIVYLNSAIPLKVLMLFHLTKLSTKAPYNFKQLEQFAISARRVPLPVPVTIYACAPQMNINVWYHIQYNRALNFCYRFGTSYANSRAIFRYADPSPKPKVEKIAINLDSGYLFVTFNCQDHQSTGTVFSKKIAK